MRKLCTVIYTYFMTDVDTVRIYFTLISFLDVHTVSEKYTDSTETSFDAILFFSAKHFFYLLHVYIFLLK